MQIYVMISDINSQHNIYATGPHQMKSFIAKRLNSILVNLRYLRFKLLKYKENNKKFVILLIITARIFLYL